MLHVCTFVRALCVGGHVQQPAAAALPFKMRVATSAVAKATPRFVSPPNLNNNELLPRARQRAA